ncbi:uncharacterized protein EV154DRAFT_516479 [Mucor mucedo]|uniref:uncharacterized protein n=1 Tax=Mucor mucedo TaxID=29922 RepID=UPI002220C5AC|nr:uncharacterized protein EV154DRAFT_516479 [Mucor mucedo]KAI7888791.1 hypothetical protein EV154DRAFT_516479 [Mucor mucedo]
MWKRAIANTILQQNPGLDVDCSQFQTCGSCIAQEGCGFCGGSGSCVSGGWFGALDKSTCGLGDYYYHQCHMSTLPLGIIMIVLTSIVVIGVLIGMGILCCCLCCKCCGDSDTEEDDTGEDRPLLGSRYLKRSSTYYQWNRPPPQQNEETNKKKMAVLDETSHNEGDTSTNKNWEDRRKALLKKYSREPVTN